MLNLIHYSTQAKHTRHQERGNKYVHNKSASLKARSNELLKMQWDWEFSNFLHFFAYIKSGLPYCVNACKLHRSEQALSFLVPESELEVLFTAKGIYLVNVSMVNNHSCLTTTFYQPSTDTVMNSHWDANEWVWYATIQLPSSKWVRTKMELKSITSGRRQLPNQTTKDVAPSKECFK